MWKSLAAAEEALEAEGFSFSKRAWVDVDRKGSLGDILVHGGCHGSRAGQGEADPTGTSATTVEHAPVPQIPEETVEVASATTDCRCANASGVGRETVGVARLVPHVRVQQRTAERTAEQIESVPRLPEEVVEEVVTLVPREREQQRTVESTRVPQTREETVEVKRFAPFLKMFNSGLSRCQCLRLRKRSFNEYNSEQPSNLRMCLNFGKGPSR